MQRKCNPAVAGGAVSRRYFAGVLVPGLYGFALRNPNPQLIADEKLETDANRTRTSLHLEVEIPASPARILSALLDEKQFAAFSGFPATIDSCEGGAFSMFGGLIEGRTIQIVPAARLVQAWRPANWDDSVFSLVRFELSPTAAGSTIVLDHSSFPEGNYDHLALGWNLRYWEPLKKFFS